MLAGPVLPPLTAPARQRGCRGGDGVGGEGGVCHRAEQEGEKQLAGAAASILPSLPLPAAAAAAAEGEPRPLHLSFVGVVGVVATR